MDVPMLLHGEGLLALPDRQWLVAFDLLAAQPQLSAAELAQASGLLQGAAAELKAQFAAMEQTALLRAQYLRQGLLRAPAVQAIRVGQSLPAAIGLPAGLWLDRHQLSGQSECAVRGFLTQVALAGGAELDFGHSTVQPLVAGIVAHFALTLAPAQLQLLTAYAGATLLRSRQGHPLAVDLSASTPPHGSSRFLADLGQQWSAWGGHQAQRETAAIVLLALVLGEQLPEGTLLFASTVLERLDQPARRLGEAVYAELPAAVKSAALLRAFGRSNRRLHRFEWLMGSMTDPAVPAMAKEQAPALWQAVVRGVDPQRWQALAQPLACAHWQAATFAALMPLIPLDQLHAPLTVAFDLTTPYGLASVLAEQVEHFSRLPVVCTLMPTAKTQVLIRDRPGVLAQGQRELVWHLPPQPADWANLAQALVVLWGGAGNEEK
ncbi:hypothetical protein ACFQ3L_00915 [Lacticaseibacillus jixianensis]|uniref:Mga helix-turn-helix domain-containing protein n=1 Tax=Lacticaseibacillus jixianensis TaxID=2486012 RepID=A0ABW4B5M3_9LACO|nr:hypothetical protein [Lacticaseibacillus jixianensis]